MLGINEKIQAGKEYLRDEYEMSFGDVSELVKMAKTDEGDALTSALVNAFYLGVNAANKQAKVKK